MYKFHFINHNSSGDLSINHNVIGCYGSPALNILWSERFDRNAFIVLQIICIQIYRFPFSYHYLKWQIWLIMPQFNLQITFALIKLNFILYFYMCYILCYNTCGAQIKPYFLGFPSVLINWTLMIVPHNLWIFCN